jgi:hypothetical protein
VKPEPLLVLLLEGLNMLKARVGPLLVLLVLLVLVPKRRLPAVMGVKPLLLKLFFLAISNLLSSLSRFSRGRGGASARSSTFSGSSALFCSLLLGSR